MRCVLESGGSSTAALQHSHGEEFVICSSQVRGQGTDEVVEAEITAWGWEGKVGETITLEEEGWRGRGEEW